MKHAYLIIANRNQDQLQLLLSLIDDARNDIFLMIDKKSEINSDKLFVKFSNLFLLSPIKIYWGSYTQIQAEMNLFESAHKNNTEYSYYHLISGLDLPLYSQDYIHSFFDNNSNKEFFTFSAMSSQKKLRLRICRYFFDNHFRSNSYFYKFIIKLQLKLYKLFFNESEKHIYFGSNWCSVDDEFVSFLLKNKEQIHKKYCRGYLVDELYKHNLLMSSRYFRNKLYLSKPVHDKPSELQGNLRYINWWDGAPKVWTSNDYNELMEARKRGFLFSRKFDVKVDKDIVNKISQIVKK